jgi:propanediol utilization protein
MAISVRHVHLTQESVERLFGPGYLLNVRSPLSQPGQYAAEETVTLVGPRGRLPHVRIVGPPRSANQVELSRTDEIELGCDAPVRESGDLTDSPGIVIEHQSAVSARSRHWLARAFGGCAPEIPAVRRYSELR